MKIVSEKLPLADDMDMETSLDFEFEGSIEKCEQHTTSASALPSTKIPPSFSQQL